MHQKMVPERSEKLEICTHFCLYKQANRTGKIGVIKQLSKLRLLGFTGL